MDLLPEVPTTDIINCLVYASYPDVSAEDFLFVQTDTTYRKVWDKSAITLEVVDNDPVDNAKSQIIYWEMLWPVS